MNAHSRSLQPSRYLPRQEYLMASLEECHRHIRNSRLQIVGIVASALLMAAVIAGYA